MIAGRGIACSLVLAVLLTLLASATVYFTDLDERILFWSVNGGTFVVLGLASFLTAKKAGAHGLLYGAAIGAGYAILTFIVGLLAFPPAPGAGAFFKRLGFSVLAGACGGILGVNS
ncbi:MAG TPA: TIGR04086 family membrane protein [Firmicutes bacterium]|uniref:TIGR04086 family membrane protein n=1 Tax=Candidatus Fermentithermobacillus carboniphilus TaxID=3085328 RepID=A0AAT9LCK7_9FIRM|nr:MAG: TIGR04086 family membrane protein [Candidatus Fermentithermobacillus carboniphilus]HHW17558.1 TIGR04086 family membrane protein [Candidatus Fermentithermobacillaceae bacterium]